MNREKLKEQILATVAKENESMTLTSWINKPEREPIYVLEFQHGGYDCQIVRSSRNYPEVFHLCGYVRIPENHPFYQKEYPELYAIGKAVKCHGGLTYSDDFWDNGSWWIGFDCAHLGDIFSEICFRIPDSGATYKELAFVKNEIHDMVEQLNAFAFYKAEI